MRFHTALISISSRRLRHHRRVLVTIGLALLLEVLYNIRSFHVTHPTVPLDEPFYIGCQQPKTNAPRENATVLMLARNADLDGAVISLASLEDTFNKWFHYPVVFLNDQEWDQPFIDAVTKVASGPVHFGVIEKSMWQYPDWIDQRKARRLMDAQAQAGILYAGNENYHHMCRFNSGFFFDHQLLQAFKWYWRVEPDIRFTCEITYDPFVEMAQNDKKYGYVMALWELGKTVPSLFRRIVDYKQKNHIATRPVWTAMMDASYFPWPLRPLLSAFRNRDADGNLWNLCHFWNNFEIADMDFFRSTEYRRLFEYLDADGGFYYERWGDASVHSLAVALLLEPAQLHHFADFGYEHAPFQYCPYIISPDGRTPDLTKTTDVERQTVGCRCKCNGDLLYTPPICLNKIKSTVL